MWGRLGRTEDTLSVTCLARFVYMFVAGSVSLEAAFHVAILVVGAFYPHPPESKFLERAKQDDQRRARISSWACM